MMTRQGAHRLIAGGTRMLLVLSLLLLPPGMQGQTDAVRVLLQRAQTLESSGRGDLAAQTWQQVLLSDPNNSEALAGLALEAKRAGRQSESDQYLARLKKANPQDAAIAKVQAAPAKSQSAELEQAGKLGAAGQYAQAMQIYRRVFGDTPPAGNWALAYYGTEAATADGKPHAIAGLRSLAQKYPSDTRYAIQLGRVLTYDAKTRPEGVSILERYPQDGQAKAALRQALVWGAQNPGSAGEIRQYLKGNKDAELTQQLSVLDQKAKADQAQRATAMAKMAANAEEREAYKAMQSGHLEDAERRFLVLNEKEPANPRVLAGLGFLRMQQQNFGGAVSYLAQAQQNGNREKAVADALTTARFWFTMGEASTAVNQNEMEAARTKYGDALKIRPTSPEALAGLAGLSMKEQRPEQAIAIYDRLTKVQPNSATAWLGLFTATAQAGQTKAALAVMRRFPAEVRAELGKNPEYLRVLAASYQADGQQGAARQVLAQAMELPFPDNGVHMKSDLQMQYAGLLMQGERFEPAMGIYRQVLAKDPNNVSAWQGLVSAEHGVKQDAQAMATVERMPQPAYDAALRDPGFLSLLASIYQSQGQVEVAQGFLEKAATLDAAGGKTVPVGLQLQLASIYLSRNNPEQAYAIYRQVLTADPQRLDAWKGLLTALHQTKHDREALAQVRQIPPDAQARLAADIDYLQTMGAVYGALGDSRNSLATLAAIQQHFKAQGLAVPADVEIQSAWLIFNSNEDRNLYPALMRLGSRHDLTDEQRMTVQTIWANWSMKRANQYAAAGKNQYSLAVLNAAARAFPDNPGVSRALAAGYLRAGQPKQSVEIYKTIDFTTAAVGDYQAAIGAALAAGDTRDAEIWLRGALGQFPHDSRILGQAARFEQARGDNGKAAAYYKASLAAMPEENAADSLAQTLRNSEPNGIGMDGRMIGQLQSAPQDLAALLAPGAGLSGAADAGNSRMYLPGSAQGSYAMSPAEGSAAPSVQRPVYSLPTYGIDDGMPPVVLSGAAGAARASNIDVDSAAAGKTRKRRKGAGKTLGGSDGGQAESEPLPLPAPMQRLGDYNPSTQVAALPGEELGTAQAENYPAGTYGRQQGEPENAYGEPTVEPYGRPAQVAAFPGDAAMRQSYSQQAMRVRDGYAPQDALPRSLPQASPDPLNQATIESLPRVAARDGGARSLQSRRKRQEPSSAMAAQNPGRPASNEQLAGADRPQVFQSQPGAAPREEQLAEVAQGPVALAARNTKVRAVEQVEVGSVVPSAMPDAAYGPMAKLSAAAAGDPLRDAADKLEALGMQDGERGVVSRLQTVQYAPSGQVYPQQGAVPQSYNPTNAGTSGGSSQAAPQPPAAGGTQRALAPPGISDEELVQRNLPPLRGFGAPAGPRQEQAAMSERQQAEVALATLEGGYSAWIGGSGLVNARSGTQGYDRLTALEAPFEFSAPLAKAVRLSVVAKPVFLNSGTTDGTSTLNLGTAAVGSIFGQQVASGVGGELQMATVNYAASAGYTPYGFLVSNVIGSLRARPAGGPVSFTFVRDSVKETQLSYSGLRDPASQTSLFPGNIWGGVIANLGEVQYAKGGTESGFYISAGGGVVNGYHVQSNTRIDGDAGAYWRVLHLPYTGDLTVGANFFGMHYDHNLRYFTYGQGGYFSPDAYLLASIPVTFNGRRGRNFHYTVTGSVGAQAFDEQASAFFPLDPALQAQFKNQFYPTHTSVGGNYGLQGEASYKIDDHWYVGGSFNFNNSLDYKSENAGFFIRYLFRAQYPADDRPTGLFPMQGLRPVLVP